MISGGTMMDVIEYKRVSRAAQAEDGMGLEEQEKRNAAWAHQTPARIVASFTDVNVSGATPVDERPAFLKALAAMKEHGAKGILVAHRDRFARDMYVAMSAEQLVKGMGGMVFSASGVGNGDKMEDTLMRHIEFVFASHDRALRRVRTMTGKILSGEVHGHLWSAPPYGYAITATPGAPAVDPVEGFWIQFIFGLRAQGMGARRIAKALIAANAPRRAGGSMWQPTEVQRILDSEGFYAGRTLQTGEAHAKPAQAPLIGPNARRITAADMPAVELVA